MNDLVDENRHQHDRLHAAGETLGSCNLYMALTSAGNPLVYLHTLKRAVLPDFDVVCDIFHDMPQAQLPL